MSIMYGLFKVLLPVILSKNLLLNYKFTNTGYRYKVILFTDKTDFCFICRLYTVALFSRG